MKLVLESNLLKKKKIKNMKVSKYDGHVMNMVSKLFITPLRIREVLGPIAGL